MKPGSALASAARLASPINPYQLGISVAVARLRQPPLQFSRVEIHRQHRLLVCDTGGVEDLAAGGVEILHGGGVEETGGVLVVRAALIVDEHGFGAAVSPRVPPRAIAEQDTGPVAQSEVLAEEDRGGAHGAVAGRLYVDHDGILGEVAHRKIAEVVGGSCGIGAVQGDRASAGEAEGVRCRVAATGSIAVLDSRFQAQEPEEEEDEEAVHT